MSEYDDIKEALTKLGDTPRAVGLKLIELGCKGVREDGTECPVFLYLTEVECIDGIERVVSNEVWLEADDLEDDDPWIAPDPSSRMALPEPVRAFVKAFDEGDWPDLERFEGAS